MLLVKFEESIDVDNLNSVRGAAGVLCLSRIIALRKTKLRMALTSDMVLWNKHKQEWTLIALFLLVYICLHLRVPWVIEVGYYHGRNRSIARAIDLKAWERACPGSVPPKH